MRPMTLEAMFGLDITQSELVYTDYLTVSIDEPGRSVESSEWLRGEERTETLISLLKPYGIKEIVRAGALAIEKGSAVARRKGN